MILLVMPIMWHQEQIQAKRAEELGERGQLSQKFTDVRTKNWKGKWNQ